MHIFPELKIGVFNGWIPLALYFIGLIVSVSFYPNESKIWLFNNPRDENNRVLILLRLFGQLTMVIYIIMLVFTPMKIGDPVFLVGAMVFIIGFTLEMSALYYFRITPVGQPVMNGPYRASRNPQWLGLFLVLLGSAIAVGIWLYLGIVILVGIIYHIQILDEETACKKKYGEGYIKYMKCIPRYLLFL